MNEQKQREFEMWCETNRSGSLKLHLEKNALLECYSNPDTQAAWLAFQHQQSVIDAKDVEIAQLRDKLNCMRADATRYRWLKIRNCNSLHISMNGNHACNYMTAKQWIEDDPLEDFSQVDPEELDRMKRTNTIWHMQIYPKTPISSFSTYGSTLDAALDAMFEALCTYDVAKDRIVLSQNLETP